MKAILLKEHGGPENLFLGEYPMPRPDAGEIRVKVKATALNRADILQRRGKYPPPKGASPLLGLEMAGVVDTVGPGCSEWKIGDRVCALLPGGGYAQYVVIPAGLAIPIPETLSFEDAAAIPEVFLTAYQALFWIGNLKSQEHVLIHAGASGIGTAAIQLVRQAGAAAIVTVGSPRKMDYCKTLGAEAAINYKTADFSKVVQETTNGKGVDLIIDCIGAPYWEQNLSILAADGRLVLLAAMGGVKMEQVNIVPILVKRLQISGTTLRSRKLAYKERLTGEFIQHILPGFSNGQYQAVVDSVFSWEAAASAHEYMEANKNMGKIVLRVED